MAIVVDEFTSSPAQGRLARAVVSQTTARWSCQPSVECSVVTAMIRNVHSDLRDGFRLSNATYGVLLTERGSSTVTALMAGDCRIGAIDGDGWKWLTQPQTKEAALLRLGVAPAPGDRSTVTRCFKPRRWIEPEVVSLAQREGMTWALATDGFEPRATPQDSAGDAEDDASCLQFSWSGFGEPDTGDGNWYCCVDEATREAG